MEIDIRTCSKTSEQGLRRRQPVGISEDIQIPNIEADLLKQREELEEKNLTKACLFNLIVYSHEQRRANYLKEIVHLITERFPCRIFFIQGKKEPSKNYLHVEVSQELVGKGEAVIGCDQITIEASIKNLVRVPFIILPHIVPDLPIYLLWGQDPASENEIFPHLKEFTSRFIFDSEATPDLREFIGNMLSLIDSLKIDFMDLNWAHLSGWRNIISQVFDSLPKMDELRSCKKINIIYCKKSECESYLHQEIQAVYLQGWLASRLDWKYISKTLDNDAIRLTYENSDGKEIVISLRPKDYNEIPPSAIMEIEIESNLGNLYALLRQGIQPKVLVHISSLEKCELPLILVLPTLRRGMSFMKELLYQPTSDHYYEMLKKLNSINW